MKTDYLTFAAKGSLGAPISYKVNCTAKTWAEESFIEVANFDHFLLVN